MEPSGEYPIARYEKGRLTPAKDTVIREARVELVVNDGEMRLAMLCLPRELKELAAGFLRGEGALRRREDLHSAEFVEAESTLDVRGEFDPDVLDAIHRRWTWGTGCGGGGTSGRLDSSGYTAVGEGITVSGEAILRVSSEFHKRLDLWRRTGGVHACALADAEKLCLLCEDVGRHNAFDKVIGKALLEGVEVADKLMLSTGRLSAEMVSKAVASGVTVLVSRGAVTGLAVELARRFGLTLVGFARAGRLNVYTGYQRVVAGEGESGRTQ